MGQVVKVAEIRDIPEGKCITFEHGYERIAVYRVNGSYYAIGDTCPHAGGPLSEGFLDGTTLTCPWHGWSFDLCTDAGDDGACRYKVRIEGEDIKVELP
ncbi:MAG: Rieske 2Fe-2S domain-containing protein [Candidatus Hydrogenedentes bacterium]|nr:Rieske 2Fe-2S domain-containing protein [Candidatus Hydrogenedentota bacterium]